MKLYHYAAQQFESLKTLEKQGKVTQEARQKALEASRRFKELFGVTSPGYYFQHISFFFEKIPLDIAKYFPKDHPVWKKGNTLFEYEVESKSLKSFDYEIVEFPEKRALYLDESVSDEDYHKAMRELYAKTPYVGFGNTEMESVCHAKGLTGILADSYKQLSEIPGFAESDNRYKYAPLVTHVMIYPNGGAVKLSSVKKIKLT